ncbi:MAG: hypothetical protein R3186_05010 [Ruegeria sp.]|nr:hypothetical protein [Ruegeria sp.]
MKTRDILATFNRGIIDTLAMARIDVRRVSLSAETQTNWMPRTLGPMSLRPGFEYIGNIGGQGYMLPFAYTKDDTALLELKAGTLRVWDDGDTLVTRASHSSTITNGGFTGSLTGWTDADDSGATSDWITDYLRLTGTGTASARRQQQVTVAVGDQGTEHSLRIVVVRGPAILRVGTTAGADDVFRQAVLRTGTHSIAFTPTSDFWIELSSPLSYPVIIDSCDFDSSGTLSLPTVWSSISDCANVRWQQSGDVIFCACSGYRQQRIERRPNNSWSVVNYETNDGPFLTENTENITLTPTALSGSVTITASRAYFQSEHVGALFRISSKGQRVEEDVTAQDTWSDPIKVTGVGNDRNFIITRTGTWVGTVTLQRSVGDVGAWADVTTYTTNGTVTYDDELDNSVIYYRIGVKTGDYTSGTVELELDYPVGSIDGLVRIIGYTSDTQVLAVVLRNLGGTDPSDVWAEGAWSDLQGWPEAVALWEGRLWWSGIGRNYGSVSDAYASFDPEVIGDSGPINRSAGDIVSNRSNWLMPLRRLIVGTDGSENSVRSTSFDEPVTPSNYNVKAASTKGSAQIPAVISDGRGYFIGRSGQDVFEVEYDVEKYGYGARELTMLAPHLGDGGFSRIAMQENPDRRLHCIKADGTAVVLIRDEAEEVICWITVETDGDIVDATVLPNTQEDRVFYTVKRTVGGTDYYYLEEWALYSECVGGTINKQADSFVSGTQASSATISGLSHLEGETVVCWGNGKDLGTYTVSSGAITASEAVTDYCVGLGYTATFKSAKLAGQTQLGLSLTQRSRINKIGLILQDTHYQGLQYGPDLSNLDELPLVENGSATSSDTVWEQYDEDMITFGGSWDTDNRVCLQAAAPRPCTVLAAVMNVDRKDKD